MNTLSDAIVYSILYINCTPAGEEREDEDARALEWLTWKLRQCGDSELESLQAAVERASANTGSFPWPAPEVTETLRAIGESILIRPPA